MCVPGVFRGLVLQLCLLQLAHIFLSLPLSFVCVSLCVSVNAWLLVALLSSHALRRSSSLELSLISIDARLGAVVAQASCFMPCMCVH